MAEPVLLFVSGTMGRFTLYHKVLTLATVCLFKFHIPLLVTSPYQHPPKNGDLLGHNLFLNMA